MLGLTPGPDNLFVLTTSVISGRKAGVVITLGLCTGLIFHSLAVAFGVAAIFKTSELAFTILKYAGSLYLLYVAWQITRGSKIELNMNKTNVDYQKLYRRGVLMNITNPKVSLFFLAFLPQFVVSSNHSFFMQTLFFGSLFILSTMIVFTSISVFAGKLSDYINGSEKRFRYMNLLTAVILIILAIKLSIGTNI